MREDRNPQDSGSQDELPHRLLTRRDVVRGGATAAGAVGVGWLLAACGGGGGEDEAATGTEAASAAGGKEVDSMNWALNGDAASMDYPFAYDFNTNVIVANVTESLLRMNAEGKLQPHLAEEWELKNPTTIVLKIRSGVPFHDGSTMTPEDVAYSLNRHRLKDINGNGPSYLGTFHERVKDVRATGSDTVTVTLVRPDAHFPYALATMAGAVASKAFIEANGKKVGTPSVGAMGTGPYKFKSWTKGQEIVVDLFDGYWDTTRALKLKQLVAKILLEETTIVQALQTGEVDAVFGNDISGKGTKATEAFDNVTIHKGPSYGIHYLAMNTEKPPFDDRRVRQALSMAIDKAGLLKSTYGGYGEAGIKSPATPAMWTFEKETFKAAYDALPSFDVDLDRAKALIKAAGAEGAKGDILNALPYDAEQAVAIQAAAKEIGLDLAPRKVEYQEKVAEEFSGKTRKYASSAAQWASDIPDPAGNLFVLFDSRNAVTNNTGYKNPKVDELFDKERDSTDPAERAKLLTEAQELIVRDQPDALFYTPDTVMILNNRLGGYQIRPLWYWDSFAADLSGT
jgi:peptide/nickel transport system substrate-binding protein